MILKDFQKYITGEYKIYNGKRIMYDLGNKVFASVIFYNNRKCEIAVLNDTKIVLHQWNKRKKEIEKI